MKKLDELKFLLVSILAINQTSEHRDSDISSILDYAFRRLYGSNTNLLTLACVQLFRLRLSRRLVHGRIAALSKTL